MHCSFFRFVGVCVCESVYESVKVCMFSVCVCGDLLRRKIRVSYADHVVLCREPTGNGRG